MAHHHQQQFINISENISKTFLHINHEIVKWISVISLLYLR
jgi:hypothetical protein